MSNHEEAPKRRRRIDSRIEHLLEITRLLNIADDANYDETEIDAARNLQVALNRYYSKLYPHIRWPLSNIREREFKTAFGHVKEALDEIGLLPYVELSITPETKIESFKYPIDLLRRPSTSPYQQDFVYLILPDLRIRHVPYNERWHPKRELSCVFARINQVARIWI